MTNTKITPFNTTELIEHLDLPHMTEGKRKAIQRAIDLYTDTIKKQEQYKCNKVIKTLKTKVNIYRTISLAYPALAIYTIYKLHKIMILI